MARTVHLGDCSTLCDTCAFQCAARGHEGCIGDAEEQARGDALVAFDQEAEGEDCSFEAWVEQYVANRAK